MKMRMMMMIMMMMMMMMMIGNDDDDEDDDDEDDDDEDNCPFYKMLESTVPFCRLIILLDFLKTKSYCTLFSTLKTD